MKNITKGLRIILMLPFTFLRIIIATMGLLIKWIARIILKNEFEDERKFLEISQNKRTELYKENEILIERNKQLSKRLERLKYIIEKNNNSKTEASLTKYGEIVLITYSQINIFDNIYLSGENGDDKFWDSVMRFKDYGSEIKIADFVTKNDSENRGYGRALMNFVIAEARRKNVKCITGDLSNVDSDSFEWLIPFYESFGFDCILFNDDKMIRGSIRLTLESPIKKVS
ncbi:GNAT family N-acetyltransferase [Chryseobacterium sp. JUb7]|uniref:GNAT family N-acetyltransferase n=1 Tax=Chryseobacterium sp. JUb7 TaxID=2940599 RepID=UPI0021675F80|nr:GNAT family N-acetyltransferase [Chryseobacterium sp. JUb7]MCS3529595.1 GNAT superfamily N-acetyltransferase [Chryseobacterium sp. JUb7]